MSAATSSSSAVLGAARNSGAQRATVDQVLDSGSALVEVERAASVARRAEWKSGFDAGLKAGTARYFQSPVMEGIAFELTLLRTLYAATCEELERRDRAIAAVNRIKHEALLRCVALARDLDRRAPGWDA